MTLTRASTSRAARSMNGPFHSYARHSDICSKCGQKYVAGSARSKPDAPVTARTMDDILADPKERTAHLYATARAALSDLLDADLQGWADALVLIRTLSRDRRAIIIEAALNEHRFHLDSAARMQDDIGNDSLFTATPPVSTRPMTHGEVLDGLNKPHGRVDPTTATNCPWCDGNFLDPKHNADGCSR